MESPRVPDEPEPSSSSCRSEIAAQDPQEEPEQPDSIFDIAVSISSPAWEAVLPDAERLCVESALAVLNVLSFPSGLSADLSGTDMLGDVILAFETVSMEAARDGKSLEAHLRHLVVHGVLHLLGYDHEMEDEATEMERREVEILGGFGISDPYTPVLEPVQ